VFLDAVAQAKWEATQQAAAATSATTGADQLSQKTLHMSDMGDEVVQATGLSSTGGSGVLFDGGGGGEGGAPEMAPGTGEEADGEKKDEKSEGFSVAKV